MRIINRNTGLVLFDCTVLNFAPRDELEKYEMYEITNSSNSKINLSNVELDQLYIYLDSHFKRVKK